jgi:hypothetical protein
MGSKGSFFDILIPRVPVLQEDLHNPGQITLGNSPGQTISGNWIPSVNAYPYGLE